MELEHFCSVIGTFARMFKIRPIVTIDNAENLFTWPHPEEILSQLKTLVERNIVDLIFIFDEPSHVVELNTSRLYYLFT